MRAHQGWSESREALSILPKPLWGKRVKGLARTGAAEGPWGWLSWQDRVAALGLPSGLCSLSSQLQTLHWPISGVSCDTRPCLEALGPPLGMARPHPCLLL